MLSIDQIKRQLMRLRQHYITKDTFVKTSMKIDWDLKEVYKECVDLACLLYQSRGRAPIRTTLLGSSALQWDKEYLLNFGFASASPLNKRKSDDQARILELEKVRTEIASGSPHKSAQAIQMLGSGSILGDPKWTTLFNDAFILGSIDAGHNFALALTQTEQKEWTAHVSRLKLSKFTNLHVRNIHNDESYWRNVWREFLGKHTEIIWYGILNSAGKQYDQPRVLARELLGLSYFGYKPVFTEHELFFEKKLHVIPSFLKYTQNLTRIGFHGTAGINNKRKVLNDVSRFLFGSESALGINRAWIPQPTKRVS